MPGRLIGICGTGLRHLQGRALAHSEAPVSVLVQEEGGSRGAGARATSMRCMLRPTATMRYKGSPSRFGMTAKAPSTQSPSSAPTPDQKGGRRPRRRRNRKARRDITSAALRHLGWSEVVDRYAKLLKVQSERERILSGLDAWMDQHLDDRALDNAFAPAQELAHSQARLHEVDGWEFLLQAQESYRQSEEAQQDSDLGREELRATLAQLEDLKASLDAAKHGEILSLYEILGVRALLQCARALGLVWRHANSESMKRWRDSSKGLVVDVQRGLVALEACLGGAQSPAFVGDREFLAELLRCVDFDDEGAPRIADSASQTLARARKQLGTARRNLERRAKALIGGHSLDGGLQDRFWTEREGRVVLPMRSDAIGRFSHEAIIHGSSQRGKTLFVEPRELVAANNALREILLEIQSEEARIQRELSAGALARHKALRSMQKSFFALDGVAARWSLGQLWGGEAVELIEPKRAPRPDSPEQAPQAVEPDALEESASVARIELPAARHPLMVLEGEEVVPNDLILDCSSGLIISGPNAGGKTVALKTLGLCVLLARAGVRIPVGPKAKLPAYRRVVTDVGDDQSIAANLSTFSAHMEHVKEALAHARQAGPETLVLFDEIAVGTDPEQGAALAEAIVTRLVRAGVTLVVTTHYERLKKLAGKGRLPFVNASVGFDLQALRPTFQLHFGLPGSSSAIAVAHRLGVDPQVLGHAEKLLGTRRRKADELLREIEAQRVELDKQQRELQHRLEGVQRREKKLEMREARAVASAHRKRQQAIEAATDELWALEKDLKGKRKALRKIGADPDLAPTRDQLTGKARNRVEKNRVKAQRDAQKIEGAGQAKPKPARVLAVGDSVRVLSLDEQGEVLSIRGDKITVQLALLKTTLRKKDLELIEDKKEIKIKSSEGQAIHQWNKAAPDLSAAKHFGQDAVAVAQSVDNRCDLRGQRVEDAFDQTEKFLDRAMQAGQDVVVLVHGHGSGELRKGLREHLRRLDHVRRFRPGMLKEGGDGATVVWIQ